MPQTRKRTSSRGRSAGQDKIRAELTSSQAMVGIVILILFGLACFLVGVLVGKFQSAPAPARIAAAPRTPPARTVVLPAPRPESSRASSVEAPRRSRRPERQPVPRPAPAPSLADASVKPVSEPKPAVTPAAATPVIVEAIEPEPEVLPSLETDRTAVKPGPHRYTVQIGAFSKESFSSQAKKRIESNTTLSVFLVDSPGRNLVIVHAGSFATKEQAEVARAELRDKLGYKDCYVTEHSIALTRAGS